MKRCGVMKRFGIFLVFLLVFSSCFFAVESVDSSFIKWNGRVVVVLDSNSLNAGDELSGKFVIFNNSEFPVLDGFLSFNLVKGSEFSYPSQFSSDNIFYENFFEGIVVAPKSYVEIPFSVSLNEELSSGDYRVDAYFVSNRAIMQGISFIFASPSSTVFNVSGNGNFPFASIDRINTKLNSFSGPIGVLVDNNLSLNFVVDNPFSKNLELVVSYSDWDDLSNKILFEQKIDLGSNQNISDSISLPLPSVPSAYSVRLEVFSDGDLVSLYRSRFIISGGTAKIRSAFPSSPSLINNSPVDLFFVLGSSPDHYTNPDFDDFSFEVSVLDLDSKDIVFFESHKLDIKFDEFLFDSFSFIPESNLSSVLVCGEVIKENEVFDSFCYNWDSVSFSEDNFVVSFNYFFEGNDLVLHFSSVDDVNAFVSVFENNDLISSKNVVSENDFEIVLENVHSENFSILVNNYSLKKQQRFFVNLSNVSVDDNSVVSCVGLGIICDSSKICDGKVINSSEGFCCLGSCIDSVSANPAPFFDFSIVSSIIVFIFSFVIFVFLLVSTMKRRRLNA